MSTRAIINGFIATSLIWVLGGCQTLTALSTQEERGLPGGKVEVILLGTDGADADLSGLPTHVTNVCQGLPPDQPVSEAASVAIPIALAAFQIVYAGSTSAIQGYVDKMRKRFTKSYGGRVNIAEFQIATGSGTETGPIVRCVRLKRSLPEKTDGQQAPIFSKSLASDLVVAFTALKNTAKKNTGMTVTPLYMKFNDFAASTAPSSDGDVVKVAITVGISMVNHDQSLGEDPIVKFEQNVLVPRVERGEQVDFSEAKPSAIMPLPKGRPATIAIAVTETGSGVQRFEGFSEDFKANSKIIGDALGNILKDRLTEED